GQRVLQGGVELAAGGDLSVERVPHAFEKRGSSGGRGPRLVAHIPNVSGYCLSFPRDEINKSVDRDEGIGRGAACFVLQMSWNTCGFDRPREGVCLAICVERDPRFTVEAPRVVRRSKLGDALTAWQRGAQRVRIDEGGVDTFDWGIELVRAFDPHKGCLVP